VKTTAKRGNERLDAIARLVGAVAVVLMLAAVAEALSIANAPKPPTPTGTASATLPVSAMTETQLAAATIAANDHRLAVTLAAVMQATPGSVVMGISPAGTAAAPSRIEDFVAQNVWVGLVNHRWISLYAGALRSDPAQGAVVLVSVLPDQVEQQMYVAPLSNGALKITSENIQRLTMVSTNGQTYIFDVLAQRFVGSLTEYAVTATPPSSVITGTVTAAPDVTGTP
jgi:hypothetical protein